MYARVRMRSDLGVGMVIPLLVGTAALTGCHDPRAEAATRTRIERINGYLTVMKERENEGPQRLAQMGHLIRDQAQRDREHLDRDARGLLEWSRGDVQRWQDRQPRYRAELRDLFDGNLEMADDIFPRMFY